MEPRRCIPAKSDEGGFHLLVLYKIEAVDEQIAFLAARQLIEQRIACGDDGILAYFALSAPPPAPRRKADPAQQASGAKNGLSHYRGGRW